MPRFQANAQRFNYQAAKRFCCRALIARPRLLAALGESIATTGNPLLGNEFFPFTDSKTSRENTRNIARKAAILPYEQALSVMGYS